MNILWHKPLLNPYSLRVSSIVLTGCSKKGVEGSIKYIGSKDKRKDKCLIMQEDHLAPLFTVHEMMTISANLKLGPSLSIKTKHLMVSARTRTPYSSR
jgi:ABC-type multidrug transport system ATPase subunit